MQVPQAISLSPRSKAAVVRYSGGAAAVAPAPSPFAKQLKLATYFTLWYGLNIGYNIYNKVRTRETFNLVPRAKRGGGALSS